MRRGQREFLNVLVIQKGLQWRIVTFEDPDFDPGFATELRADDEQHVLEIAIFSDNADTVTRSLLVHVGNERRDVDLRLV